MNANKAHRVDPKRAKRLKVLLVAELHLSVLQQLTLTPVPRTLAVLPEHEDTQPFVMSLLPST